MHLIRKFTSLALLTTLVLGAAESLTAQAKPLGAGGGVVQQGPATRIYAFHCVQMPDGSAAGALVSLEPANQSFVRVRITSAMHIGPWLAVAGEITAAVNTPPQIVVGGTMAAVFADNGTGGPVPDQLAALVVPAFLGNLTIQQIIALVGPPPPTSFGPVLAGDFRVF